MDRLMEELNKLLENRENQLNYESYQSYNYGYVAGEISGIKKAMDILREIK